MIPCILFEDEHLLAANKPTGLNTHAPSPFAGEGLYDWLRHREPRWADLAIIHRLDKETSGVIVFGKTPLANRSLTEQFAGRAVRKKYLLLTDRKPAQHEFTARSKIARAGDRYISGARGEMAETRFCESSVGPLSLSLSPSEGERATESKYHCVAAWPITGRTHQIRVHAAENGFPVLGDTLYGGTPFARVCLHATELTLRHPETGKELTFTAPPDFVTDPRQALRRALLDPTETTACRLIHGAADGQPGWYVDLLGEYLLSQGEEAPKHSQLAKLETLHGESSENPQAGGRAHHSVRAVPGKSDAPPEGGGQGTGTPYHGIYHKTATRHVRRVAATAASPKLVSGEAAPPHFTILENGVNFELSFDEGYSVGLFLDQRDNRRRLLTGHIAADFDLQARSGEKPLRVLNTFAYTCGFSVCAALAGMETTSLDLSRKYLDWGRRNFAQNGLDAGAHEFIYGDVFDWLHRLAKKGRRFDVILLDPPTFSQSKVSGVFRAEKDFGKLVAAALPVLSPGGVLFASCNAAELAPERFLEMIDSAFSSARRRIGRRQYFPQPPDFPVSRAEPAYLKTVWIREKSLDPEN